MVLVLIPLIEIEPEESSPVGIGLFFDFEDGSVWLIYLRRDCPTISTFISLSINGCINSIAVLTEIRLCIFQGELFQFCSLCPVNPHSVNVDDVLIIDWI